MWILSQNLEDRDTTLSYKQTMFNRMGLDVILHSSLQHSFSLSQTFGDTIFWELSMNLSLELHWETIGVKFSSPLWARRGSWIIISTLESTLKRITVIVGESDGFGNVLNVQMPVRANVFSTGWSWHDTNGDPNIGPLPSFVFFHLPLHLSSNYHQILYTSLSSVY